MATMQFDLVSPEKRLASVEATAVQIPGDAGDLTAMRDHAPMITALRPGIITVETNGGSQAYLVTGGFADLAGPSTTVLAEQAYAVNDIDSDLADSLLEASSKALEDAAQLGEDGSALKRHEDLKAALSSVTS